MAGGKGKSKMGKSQDGGGEGDGAALADPRFNHMYNDPRFRVRILETKRAASETSEETSV